MKTSLSTDTLNSSTAEIVAVAVSSKKSTQKKRYTALARSLGGAPIAQLAADEGFEGKKGQTLKVAARGRMKARWVLLVGIGDSDDAVVTSRLAAQGSARAVKQQKTLAVELPEVSADTVRAAAEGLLIGSYRYLSYKTKDKDKAQLRSASLLIGSASNKGLTAAMRAGRAIGESINLARDLVNGPPNDITPLSLARIASTEAKKLGLTVRVWDKKRIEKEGMNLFLAVNKGSAIEPRMVHITYKPTTPKKKVVFVGKGLTFDAGGLCLKPAKSMIDMKCDMSGAATTLGIVLAAARLKLPIEVHAIIGSTENMTGAKAYRPGDVYTSHEGKTVEIINTDAEGRLVLADCLSWATRLKPDYLVDHATLTGACMVALGPYSAGLYTDNDKFADAYLAAGQAEEESFWRMPLNRELRKSLKSSVADIKHIGGPYGGSITAALFLKEFVGKSNWMHLDIAGPAFLDSPHGRHPKGGTGFGVATGVRFLEGLSKSR